MSLTDTASEKKKLHISNLQTSESPTKIRFKPENEANYRTDRYGYTEEEIEVSQTSLAQNKIWATRRKPLIDKIEEKK